MLAARTAFCSAILLLLAAAGQHHSDGAAALAEAVKDRTAGKPVDCIPLSAIRSSRVIDRTAILYDTGRTLFVNTPAGADLLDEDDVLVTRTHSGELCSLDIVELVDRATQTPRGSVGLGKFVPYAKVTPKGQ